MAVRCWDSALRLQMSSDLGTAAFPGERVPVLRGFHEVLMSIFSTIWSMPLQLSILDPLISIPLNPNLPPEVRDSS